MSIPLDRLYHYIESVANQVYGDTIIYRFWPHGSKNIEDLTSINEVAELDTMLKPQIICNDQEPLNFNLYQDHISHGRAKHHNEVTLPLFKLNLRKHPFNIFDQCILLHSEKNSPEVIKYKNAGFIPVYYWSHALIALDWFRYAQHIEKDQIDQPIDFLIYNRAWSGTREYRLKFADLLIKNNLLKNSKTSLKFSENDHYSNHVYKNIVWKPTERLEDHFVENTTTSCYSADFEIQDYQFTRCEVVLETLFETQQIQLTEKILRPIAMGHPFLLCGPAGSLQYLRDYGFKTFDSVFEEKYDLISNPVDRLGAVISVMKTISEWSLSERKIKFAQMKKIANFNKKHFFSKKFKNTVFNELRTNLSTGLQQLIQSNTFNRCINLNEKILVSEPYMTWQNNWIDPARIQCQEIAYKTALELKRLK